MKIVAKNAALAAVVMEGETWRILKMSRNARDFLFFHNNLTYESGHYSPYTYCSRLLLFVVYPTHFLSKNTLLDILTICSSPHYTKTSYWMSRDFLYIYNIFPLDIIMVKLLTHISSNHFETCIILHLVPGWEMNWLCKGCSNFVRKLLSTK